MGRFKVAELKGYRSMRAFHAFHSLMLGLNHLPAYRSLHYEKFYEMIQQLPENEQEDLVREAALFVNLEKEELDALISFCKDANGVPFSDENIKNLGPGDMHEIIVCVAMEIAKIKITLVTEGEKKN
jgi:hypothetical protein